jgi:hypothetical protein
MPINVIVGVPAPSRQTWKIRVQQGDPAQAWKPVVDPDPVRCTHDGWRTWRVKQVSVYVVSPEARASRIVSMAIAVKICGVVIPSSCEPSPST